MQNRFRLAAIILAFALAPLDAASSLAEPCAANAEGVTACGQGTDMMFVLDGTTSPSGKLAIAWRAKAGTPDTETVENHLVRLEDGKDLALVVGRMWSNSTGMANHVTETVVWSPDSRWVLVGDSGKWALEALAIYAVDEASGAVEGLGLFRDLTQAAARVLNEQVGSAKAKSYLLDIASDKDMAVGDDGAVSLPMRFQVPKQDMDIDLLARFTASLRGGKLAITPIKVALDKSD